MEPPRPSRRVSRPVRPVTPRPPFSLRTRGVKNIAKKDFRIVGPGNPPPGFLNSWNSRTEWIVYWALSKVFEDPEDPRDPPYIGGQRWEPQRSIMGGRMLGGQVVDFVITLPNGRDIALDVQTEYYHLTTNPYQNALEAARILNMARYFEVVSVHESRLTSDPTGQQAVATIIDALGGRRRLNPRAAGTYSKTRRGRLYGPPGEDL